MWLDLIICNWMLWTNETYCHYQSGSFNNKTTKDILLGVGARGLFLMNIVAYCLILHQSLIQTMKSFLSVILEWRECQTRQMPLLCLKITSYFFFCEALHLFVIAIFLWVASFSAAICFKCQQAIWEKRVSNKCKKMWVVTQTFCKLHYIFEKIGYPHHEEQNFSWPT